MSRALNSRPSIELQTAFFKLHFSCQILTSPQHHKENDVILLTMTSCLEMIMSRSITQVNGASHFLILLTSAKYLAIP